MATVDREKLYEQVWTIPGVRLATLYGISDVGLARVCKRYKIPRPDRGYWARIAAGQKVRKTPLPNVNGDHRATVHMQGWDVPDEILQLEATTAPAMPSPPSLVVDSPTAPHALVLAAKAQLETAQPDQNGLLRTDALSAPTIRVSPSSVPRTLTLLGALITKWEARGGTIVVGAVGGIKTAMAIGPDELYIELYEETDESKPVSDPSRLTGRLAAVIDGADIRRRWADRKTQRIEKVISTLVATAAQALEMKKAERLDAECAARQKRRVNELRRAAVAKKDLDFGRRRKLMEYVNRWHDAERIRRYLAALQAALDGDKIRPVNEEDFREWFEWAKHYADSIDPIVQAKQQDDQSAGSKMVSSAELDLSRRARAFVSKLKIKGSDDLAGVTSEQVQTACGYYDRELWVEICRVLEGLGYDTAKRRNQFGWF